MPDMRAFFNEHPYLRIFIITILYMTVLFTWGKVFRDVEWYLDDVNVWIAGILTVVGGAFSAMLIYFRYTKSEPVTGAGSSVGDSSIDTAKRFTAGLSDYSERA